MIVKKQNSMIIPPYWVDLLVSILTLIAGYAFRYLHQYFEINESARNLRLVEFIIGMGYLVFFKSCVHYSFGNGGIVVRFLWIPIRLIKWDLIENAEYIYKWNTGVKYFGDMDGQGIFVTLQGCSIFVPEVDGLNLFLLRHPFRSLFIRFTPRNQKAYVAAFKAHCPQLEFQLGYEKNLQGET